MLIVEDSVIFDVELGFVLYFFYYLKLFLGCLCLDVLFMGVLGKI